jgi:ParB-like chromosome segregation protein Spo0J
MQIKDQNPSDLACFKSNSRTHSEHQISEIAASIKEFGFTNPVLVDEKNTIIAGHGRVEAAIGLGLSDIPTIELKGLTDVQVKAYVIADNQLALNAGWDFDQLKTELIDLEEDDFDLSLLGFDDDFLSSLEEIEPKDPIFKEITEVDLSNKCPRCNFEYD